MKYIIVIALFLYLVNGLEYKDYYDEVRYPNNEANIRSGYETPSEPLIYDLNKAPEIFLRFIEDYKKTYKDENDFNKHYGIFVKNLEEINRLNKEGGTATFEINMFADMEDPESS